MGGVFQLLTVFAEGLERGPFEERAVPRIIELAQDQEFRVRKVGYSPSTPRTAYGWSEHVWCLEYQQDHTGKK